MAHGWSAAAATVGEQSAATEDLLLPYIFDVFLAHNSLLLVVQQKRGSFVALIPHCEGAGIANGAKVLIYRLCRANFGL
jgi:hypothetical protein